MSLNPLAPVTDYQSMLNRIFWFTAASAVVAIWILRLHVPIVNQWLTQVDFTVAFGRENTLPMPGGYLLPALTVGVLSRVFRLHSRISDWLGIREYFDVGVILREFAQQLDIDTAGVTTDELIEDRHRMMRRAFYAFVSGPSPTVDPQLVHQALDAWSWLWVGIEAAAVFIACGFGLVACGLPELGLEIIGATLILASVGFFATRAQCKRYAIAQVRAIVSTPAGEMAARDAFAELSEEHYIQRRAA
jgi:hypothetical protein